MISVPRTRLSPAAAMPRRIPGAVPRPIRASACPGTSATPKKTSNPIRIVVTAAIGRLGTSVATGTFPVAAATGGTNAPLADWASRALLAAASCAFAARRAAALLRRSAARFAAACCLFFAACALAVLAFFERDESVGSGAGVDSRPAERPPLEDLRGLVVAACGTGAGSDGRVSSVSVAVVGVCDGVGFCEGRGLDVAFPGSDGSVIVMDDSRGVVGVGGVSEVVGVMIAVSVSGGGSTGMAAGTAPGVTRASTDATPMYLRHRRLRLKQPPFLSLARRPRCCNAWATRMSRRCARQRPLKRAHRTLQPRGARPGRRSTVAVRARRPARRPDRDPDRLSPRSPAPTGMSDGAGAAFVSYPECLSSHGS